MNAPVRISAEALALVSVPKGVERLAIKGREDWLKMRESDVTASVAGALLGVHEYSTAYGLYMEKAGLAPAQEPVEPTIEDDCIILPPMLRGTVLEQAAIVMARMLKPDWKIEGTNNAYYRMPAARIGATPDAIATDPERPGFGVVQIKTTDGLIFKQKWLDEDGAVQVPLWIAVQALVEAKLTGASWACVALMVGGINTKLHLFDIPLHDGVWSRLVEEVGEFWRRVAEQDAPDPDYARDGRWITSNYSGEEGVEIDLSTDNRLVTILDERTELKAAEKAGTEAEKKRKELDAEILAKLGTASIARAADGRVVKAKTIRVNRKPSPASSYSYPKITVTGEAA
ncbi:YqaJ viral recombinase family protein [Bosea sp. 2YAB26]|uniref:YqaJ viral recombinase family nuclease n=1 Tax=Bosea sp. 2YAB26 TaxID=3237478 RepID=UPI003F924A79